VFERVFTEGYTISLFFHDLSITLGTDPDPIKYLNIYIEHESADQTFSDIGFCQS